MDGKQLLIDWDKRDRDLQSLRRHLVTVLAEDADVRLLLAIARLDTTRDPLSYIVLSKRNLATEAGFRSANTVVAALRRLRETQAVTSDVSSDKRAHEILVDWRGVWKLTPRSGQRERLEADLRTPPEPPDPGVGQGLVRAGQTQPHVYKQKSKPRVTPESVSVSECAPRGIEARLVRPWSHPGGLTDEDLRWAVANRSSRVLRRLYEQGLLLEYWGNCEAYRQRFLACCWQAVTSAKKSAMGLLQRLVRDNLRDHADGWRSTLSNDSDSWATETRRQWNTPPEYAAARAARRNLGLVGGEEVVTGEPGGVSPGVLGHVSRKTCPVAATDFDLTE